MVDTTSRQVTLQTKHSALTYGSKTVPELKVSSIWLEAAGFKAGELVTIIVSEKELIITAIKPETIYER